MHAPYKFRAEEAATYSVLPYEERDKRMFKTNNDEARRRHARSEVPVVVLGKFSRDLVGRECIKVPRDMQSLRK